MSFVIKLKCSRCGKEFHPDEMVFTCPNNDDGRLDIHYDYSLISKKVTKNALSHRHFGVWKYRELLPVRNNKHVVTIKEGGTQDSAQLPLRRAYVS